MNYLKHLSQCKYVHFGVQTIDNILDGTFMQRCLTCPIENNNTRRRKNAVHFGKSEMLFFHAIQNLCRV